MQHQQVRIQRRCRLFRARDFYSLMRPCFVMCLIFGLFPYKITSSGFAPSRVGCVYSTICIMTYVSSTALMIYMIDISQNTALKYDNIPGKLQGNFYMILGLSMALLTYFMNFTRMRFLQKLMEVSARLPSDSFNKMSKLVHAKDLFGFLFLIGQIPNVISSNILQTVGLLNSMYTTMIVFLMDMFYMNCVCIIKACFVKINENLMNLQEVMLTDEPHLLRRVYQEQKNPLLLMELKAIKKRHQQVSDVLQSLNSIFGFQIIITSVMTFAEITFSLYFYILCKNSGTQMSFEKQIWYSYFTTSIFYYSVKLSLIAWTCESGKNCAAEIGSTIHDIIISTSDKTIKDELQLFSLQVLHRDNTFSAKGLSMDVVLLKTIVGNVTTYLLILIQFMISSNKDKKPEEAKTTTLMPTQ